MLQAATPFRLQLPIGAEEHFKGVIDLINWKGITLENEQT